jgi:hypothetical protein
MDQRVYHGNITPEDIARSLVGHFNRGNLRVQAVGNSPSMVVQIATAAQPASGGQTALSISLRSIEDGVSVQIGQQAWLGVAANLGMSAIVALRNPFALLSRLDDIAQDIEYIQLSDEVWKVIDDAARSLAASHQLSERLLRIECEYCGTANPVGEPRCIACGAPLGASQPTTCARCGYVVVHGEKICPNCGVAITGK